HTGGMHATWVCATFLLAAPIGGRRDVVSVRPPEIIEILASGRGSARVQVTVAASYHVQANPASEKYLIPTELQLAGDGALRVGPVVYPTPRPFRLAGGDKDIATYDGNFEITVSVAAAADAKPGERVLRGALRYQACDARTCLPPTTTPVQLTVRVVTSGPRKSLPERKKS